MRRDPAGARPADTGREAGTGERRALLALALASFAIGTGEFVIVGLVPALAADLRVAVPTAGLLVSGYALSVAFGSPIVAALLSAVPRRGALLILMGIFIAGDVACALAPGFRSMMVARVATALAHGAFFGIASIVAAELAPPGRGARAVALLFTGLTVANVLGVPAGTWIGNALGWRFTFVLVAALAAAALLAIALAVPAQAGGAAGGGLRRELASLRRGRIWLVMSVSTLSSTALFTVLTFLVPLLGELAGLTPRGGAWALLVFGVGLSLGGLLGGRLADRGAAGAILALLVADALALVALALCVRSVPLAMAAVLAWGVAAFALVPPLQHRVVAEGRDASRLASTLNQSAFNVGDALGAGLGAAALTRTNSIAVLPWLGAAILCVALVPAVLGRRESPR